MGECSSNCSSNCTSKPFVEAQQGQFASNIEEAEPYGETLNHPFERAETLRTARIRTHG